MNIKHTKSQCCSALIWNFGARRRQCSECRRTWRIRKKKIGRKKIRGSAKLVEDILLKNETMAHRASRGKTSFWACRLRFHREVERLLKKKHEQKISKGKLILIVDGLWLRFKDRRWIVYLIAVRGINSNQATILEPMFLSGAETSLKWDNLFNHLDSSIKKRVVALVCDGITGMNNCAHKRGWVFQRCQFHFLTVLERFRGRVNKNVGLKDFREDFFLSIKYSLYEKDHRKYEKLANHIQDLTEADICPKWLRFHGHEFIRRREEFRTYLKYPKYNLPTTTSAMEKYCGTLRELLHRSHGFRTIKSLKKWIILYARINNKITCNGKKPTKINQ